MDTPIFTLAQVRDLEKRLHAAKTMEEFRKIAALIPSAPRFSRTMDDGIYDDKGNLIGERHPDD